MKIRVQEGSGLQRLRSGVGRSMLWNGVALCRAREARAQGAELLNPISALKPKPGTLNPHIVPRPGSRESPSLKPQTLNPRPQTFNPKPYTLNLLVLVKESGNY